MELLRCSPGAAYLFREQSRNSSVGRTILEPASKEHTFLRSCNKKSSAASLRLHRLSILLLEIRAGRLTVGQIFQGSLSGCALAVTAQGHAMLLALVTKCVDAIV